MSTATAVPETYRLEGDDALETLRRTGWGQLAKDAFDRFRVADGFSHSRALAFQLVLTGMPAIIAAVGLITQLDRRGLRRVLERMLLGLAPGPAGQVLQRAFQQGSSAGRGALGALLIGLGAALWSGTLAMAQVERGANRIYGVEQDRDALGKYATAAVLTCSAGVLIAIAFVLLVAGPAIAGSGSDALATTWSLARWPVGAILVIAAFSLLLKTSPNRMQPAASWLSVGSAVALVLWLLFTGLLGLYVTVSEGFGRTYGPLAGTIGVLLWAYSASLALYLGVAAAAQLEAVRAGVPQPEAAQRANPSS